MTGMRAAAASLLAGALWWGCDAPAPAPPLQQPLPFSHRLHAGEYRIGCTLCHAYAAHSPIAGIPSMQRCDGCHKLVGRDKPAIQQLEEAVAGGTPIAWNRVYRLPDHVRFTHQRHVAAGLSCQTCHGEVQTMDVVRQVAPLTMGWCLQCHEARGAPRDCLVCHK